MLKQDLRVPVSYISYISFALTTESERTTELPKHWTAYFGNRPL